MTTVLQKDVDDLIAQTEVVMSQIGFRVSVGVNSGHDRVWMVQPDITALTVLNNVRSHMVDYRQRLNLFPNAEGKAS